MERRMNTCNEGGLERWHLSPSRGEQKTCLDWKREWRNEEERREKWVLT